jgi:hypothetical protein
MQSTIELFRHLYKNIPPLFPTETRQKIAHALEHLESDQTITLREIEDTMIEYGYELWPWNQAYKEFLATAESAVGEHFLLPRLSPLLHAKYLDFKHFGGTLRDLHSGRPADYFDVEERRELSEKLVELQKDLHKYAEQEITGLSKSKYLRRVEEFADLLAKIESTLEMLRDLADKEQDHPTLADEIRSKVKGFEYSLCLLGPELDYEAVFQSIDFFKGRKEDLNRLRGINVPGEFDFFSE